MSQIPTSAETEFAPRVTKVWIPPGETLALCVPHAFGGYAKKTGFVLHFVLLVSFQGRIQERPTSLIPCEINFPKKKFARLHNRRGDIFFWTSDLCQTINRSSKGRLLYKILDPVSLRRIMNPFTCHNEVDDPILS